MDFKNRVFALTIKIPRGKVVTYQLLAKALGDPKKARAVGNALNKNIDTKNIPCHRVVRSDGQAGGYAFGNAEKIKKLKSEGLEIKNGVISSLSAILFKFKH
ncbi:MAG: MGMT family protein [bacterium]|nr:MGMT family protein [bacterium]